MAKWPPTRPTVPIVRHGVLAQELKDHFDLQRITFTVALLAKSSAL
jgi:hypothetical protein